MLPIERQTVIVSDRVDGSLSISHLEILPDDGQPALSSRPFPIGVPASPRGY
jgi:hypothetical protein